MKRKSGSQSAPARRSLVRRPVGEGGFFNLRVLVGLFVFLAGVFLALLGFGAFSNASAEGKGPPKTAGITADARLSQGDVALKYDPTRHLDEHGYRPSGVSFAPLRSGKSWGSRGASIAGEGAWSSLGPPGGDVADAAVSTVDPNVVLAGIAPDGGFGGTLYRSSDGGSTWSEVPALTGTSVFDIEFAAAGNS